MNKLLTIAVSGLCPMLVAAQAAPTALEPVQISISAPITLPAKIYQMSGREFKTLAGQYELSNGSVLTLSGSARRMHAQIDTMPRVDLVAGSPVWLTAGNKQMRIQFQLLDNGIVDKMTVTYMRPRPAAARNTAFDAVTIACRC
jgi:hypothetical protein